jgi:ribosome small subunit-dependent GTPase A
LKNIGRIIKSTGGLYHVADSTETNRITECRAKGTFRKDKIVPLVGDMVEYEAEEKGDGTITGVLPRKNALIRPAVANVDLLCIIVAAAEPMPDLYMLDKLTAVATHNAVDIFMIINKADIADSKYLEDVYGKAGIKTIVMSTVETDSYDEAKKEILAAINGKISFFTGASGVGKTSLINLLFPGFDLVTGILSKKISRGKHTTRCTELYKTNETSYIGDTPGFSMLEVATFRLIPKDGLVASFPDIAKFASNCKYKSCTHLCEEGCQVIKAVEGGEIVPSRHESYKLLFDELKHTNDWDVKNN